MSMQRRTILTTALFGLALLSLFGGLALIQPSGDVYHEFITPSPPEIPGEIWEKEKLDIKLLLKLQKQDSKANSTAIDGHEIKAKAKISPNNDAEFFLPDKAISQVYICGDKLEFQNISELKLKTFSPQDNNWRLLEDHFKLHSALPNGDNLFKHCKASTNFAHLNSGSYRIPLAKEIEYTLILTSQRGPERLPLFAISCALCLFLLSFYFGFKTPKLKLFTSLNLRHSTGAIGLFILAILGLAPLLKNLLANFPAQTLQSFEAKQLIYYLNFHSNFAVVTIILSLAWLQYRRKKNTALQNLPKKVKDSDTAKLSPPNDQVGKRKKLRQPKLLAIFGMAVGLVSLAYICLILNPSKGIILEQSSQSFLSIRLLITAFAILAALIEELFYRGILQTGIENTLKLRPINNATIASLSILIPSLIFLSMHIPQTTSQPAALIPIAALSLLSGTLKWHYKRILPSIALHMLYNALILLSSFVAFL